MTAQKGPRVPGRAALRAELNALSPEHYDRADKIVARYVAELREHAERAAARAKIPADLLDAFCDGYVAEGTQAYRDVLRAWEGAAR